MSILPMKRLTWTLAASQEKLEDPILVVRRPAAHAFPSAGMCRATFMPGRRFGVGILWASAAVTPVTLPC